VPNSRIELSPGRRFMADLSWLALKVPTSVLKRTIDLGPLSEARAASAESGLPPEKWSSLMYGF